MVYGGLTLFDKMMETLKEKAIRSNGGDRMCEHCVYHAENICKVCGEAYVRGFVKGYKQKQKEDRV